MQYTDIIFDLYGTLVDIHTEEDASVWEKTALFYGFYGASYTAETLKESFDRAMQLRQAKAGHSYECFPDIPCQEVFSQLFLEKGISDPTGALGFQAAQLFRICSIRHIRLYPGVVSALQQLKQQGYRLWLLSNAQRVFTQYELQLLGLTQCFDGIYISSDYQCRKPDVRFFTALLQEQNLQPEHCLMIGNDRQTDIAGAKQAGLDTLYLHANITPLDQAPADPALFPSIAPCDTHHFEFEGTNWNDILPLLLK